MRRKYPLSLWFTGRSAGIHLSDVPTNGLTCSTRNVGSGGHYRAARAAVPEMGGADGDLGGRPPG